MGDEMVKFLPGMQHLRLLAMVAAAFLLLGAHTTVQAQTIKAAYVELPPYTYTDAAGSPQGSLVELLAKVSADAGYAYTAESAPARRLFQGVVDGQYDMFIGIKTPEPFQGTTIASKSVIANIELRAWGIGGAPAIKAKEDLAGKQVIVLTGYSYGGWRTYLDDPANGVQMIEARTPEQALQLLTAGRAPVLLQYALPMARALAAQPTPNLQSALISSLDCHFVVSLKRPDAAELLAKLDASFEKLKAAGKLP
jgi:polar amino acid transport system substrate-binding protein